MMATTDPRVFLQSTLKGCVIGSNFMIEQNVFNFLLFLIIFIFLFVKLDMVILYGDPKIF